MMTKTELHDELWLLTKGILQDALESRNLIESLGYTLRALNTR